MRFDISHLIFSINMIDKLMNKFINQHIVLYSGTAEQAHSDFRRFGNGDNVLLLVWLFRVNVSTKEKDWKYWKELSWAQLKSNREEQNTFRSSHHNAAPFFCSQVTEKFWQVRFTFDLRKLKFWAVFAGLKTARFRAKFHAQTKKPNTNYVDELTWVRPARVVTPS